MESKRQPRSKVNQRDSKSKIAESTTVTASVVDSNLSLSKDAQFKKYLLKTGFKYAITRAIVALYEDSQKPDDPLSYIIGFLGHGIPNMQMLQSHQSETKELREKILKLQQENSDLKGKIDKHEEADAMKLPVTNIDWKQFENALTDDEEEFIDEHEVFFKY